MPDVLKTYLGASRFLPIYATRATIAVRRLAQGTFIRVISPTDYQCYILFLNFVAVCAFQEHRHAG